MAHWRNIGDIAGHPRGVGTTRHINEDGAGGGGVAPGTVVTQDEGIVVDPVATTLNFVGAGVTATDAGGNVTTVTIPGAAGGIAGIDTFQAGTLIGTADSELNWDVDQGATLQSVGVRTDITLFDPAAYVYFGDNTRVNNSGTGSTTVGPNASTVGSDKGSAFGSGSLAQGKSPTAVGDSAKARNDYTVAAGFNSEAQGINSIAVGANAFASSNGAHAIGWQASAINTNAQAIGAFTAASGVDSSATGLNCIATGQNSAACGTSAQALATNSSACGSNAVARGENSTGLGYGDAVGDFSVAINSLTYKRAQIAIGDGAYVEQDFLAAGIGEANVAIGGLARAAGDRSTALGAECEATDGSLAAGRTAIVRAADCVALGVDTLCNSGAKQSVAVGSLAQIQNGASASTISGFGANVANGASGSSCFGHTAVSNVSQGVAIGGGAAANPLDLATLPGLEEVPFALNLNSDCLVNGAIPAPESVGYLRIKINGAVYTIALMTVQ